MGCRGEAPAKKTPPPAAGRPEQAAKLA